MVTPTTTASAAAALAALGLPAATTTAATSAVTNQLPLVGSITSGRLTYFGLVGEGGVRFGWYPTEHVRLTAGYSFIYWNNVRRAQDVFALSPALRSRAIEFTTHMVSFGVEVRY